MWPETLSFPWFYFKESFAILFGYQATNFSRHGSSFLSSWNKGALVRSVTLVEINEPWSDCWLQYKLRIPGPIGNSSWNIACLVGAEVSASGLKIGRSPVQVSPQTNFSIKIKLPVKTTEEWSRIRFDLKTVDYLRGIKYYILFNFLKEPWFDRWLHAVEMKELWSDRWLQLK